MNPTLLSVHPYGKSPELPRHLINTFKRTLYKVSKAAKLSFTAKDLLSKSKEHKR